MWISRRQSTRRLECGAIDDIGYLGEGISESGFRLGGNAGNNSYRRSDSQVGQTGRMFF